MNSIERVKTTIQRRQPDRLPLHGWVRNNRIDERLAERFGSVDAFEDTYCFDLASVGCGVHPYWGNVLDELRHREGTAELTPDLLLQYELPDPNYDDAFGRLKKQVDYWHERGRFVYVWSHGIFECLNNPFGIENHLCYLLEYPDELRECYRRQAEWNHAVAQNAITAGADMIHVSDDWGGQEAPLFSPAMWREMIFPFHRERAELVRNEGVHLSFHSDGNIMALLDGIVELGYEVVHPFQASAGMDWEVWKRDYSDKFTVMGGLCVQTQVGFDRLEQTCAEIEQLFHRMAGTPFICCTSHFVQEHCSVEELVAIYDLAYRLCRETRVQPA